MMTVARALQRRPLWSRILGASVICSVVGLVTVTPAWAHVTMHPGSLPAGSRDVELTFRVPNERDNANTVNVQVFFPTRFPLLTVNVLVIPGWTASVHTQNLETPVQTDDGPVTQIVADVTWKATAGGIAPGQYEDIEVAAGSVPDKPAQLVFKTLQAYSSGEVVRWLEAPAARQPPPDFPAAVLTITPGSSAAVSAAAPSAGSVPGSQAGSTTAEVLAVIALALATTSLVGLLLVVRRNRRRVR